MKKIKRAYSKTQEMVISLVKNQPGITLDKLLTSDPTVADDIFRLIVNNDVFVDLHAAPLSEPWRVHLFIAQEVARAYASINPGAVIPFSELREISWVVGARVIWDGKPLEIINIGESRTALRNEEGQVIHFKYAEAEAMVARGEIKTLPGMPDSTAKDWALKIIKEANIKDLTEAERRQKHLLAYKKGELIADNPVSNRTLRRWLKAEEEAEKIYGEGNGYLALIGRKSRQGNCERKLAEDTLTLIHRIIEDHLLQVKRINKIVAYGIFLVEAESKKIPTTTYQTFCKEAKTYTAYRITKATQGDTAAYKYEPFLWLEQTTPRHGERPFAVGHIDHTPLDVQLISHQGVQLGRPWLTFLSDAFSRRVLAFYLTFDRPSFRSCMMVIRICVQRHNKLPAIFIVDGGSEFQSTYFEALLGRLACTKKVRPQKKGRYGSTLERLFGVTMEQFVHTLAGNTQNSKNPRLLTPETNPKMLAKWMLSDFAESLSDYVYDVYDTHEHSSLGQSPREAFEHGIAMTGSRPNKLIPYNEEFKILSLPASRKGNAKVIPGRGINVLGSYYWNDLFGLASVENSNVDVKEDPDNAGVKYAYVNGKWEQCISEYFWFFKGRTTREIQMISQAIRAQRKKSGEKFKTSAKQIAEFYLRNYEKEKVLDQRLKDQERKAALVLLEGGRSEDISKAETPREEQTKAPVKKSRYMNSDAIKSCGISR